MTFVDYVYMHIGMAVGQRRQEEGNDLLEEAYRGTHASFTNTSLATHT